MPASIDVGSNTVRMLIGEVRDGRIVPREYVRRITRLGGGFSPKRGLAQEARQRTLEALTSFARRLEEEKIREVRAVGTQAFRKSVNGAEFADRIRRSTGLPLRIVDGEEEAYLTSLGVRSALRPRPEFCLVFDLGGGSTEFILCREDEILFRRSYPLGVVTLCEEASSPEVEKSNIASMVDQLVEDLSGTPLRSLKGSQVPLVGTAGTVTTLAALHLKMARYDWRRVNNLVLDRDALHDLEGRLAPLSISEREMLPGMEPGRGDLILPGLRLIESLMDALGQGSLVVSDFGLLEGMLLSAPARD